MNHSQHVMKRHTWALAACLGLAIVTSSAASAAGTELMSAQKNWELQRLGGTTISPDGRLAVVSVTRYDVKENKGFADLWMIPTAGGEARQLTADPASDTQPVFSPDGRWIAFVSKRGDDTENQIYVIPTDGGEARRLTSVPTGASVPKWFPDSQRIAFVSEIWIDLVNWDDQAKRRQEREDSKMRGKLWSKAPVSYWDHYLDDREAHVFSIALTGGDLTAITRLSGFQLSKQEYDSDSYDLSPDGLEIAIATDTDRSGVRGNYDIVTLATCGCKPAQNLTPSNPADDRAPRYSPDGKWLAFSQQRIWGFYADRGRLILVDRANGTQRDLSGDWDRTVNSVEWLPDSRGLLSAVDDAATNRIYRFDLSGRAPRAVTVGSSYTSLAIAARGGANPTAVALRQNFSDPATLVRVDLRNGNFTRLSTFNDSILAGLKLGKVESVTYKGANDADIQMWVIYPPDFDPTKKYPVYMLLHGGPHNGIQDALTYRWNAHVFASWGYVVTWHNFHGSSGFGQAFTDSINPDQITFPYEDTIKAANWLKAQPWADAERMVAGGGSYGGFLASTLLGRPHPFKALIAHAAVYNNFTQIAADYGAEHDRFYEFWEKPEEFMRGSPHSSAANFNTPTLVIHGLLDRRVPVNHGLELFNTLQKRGIASKFLYFDDENHWVLKPQNSLFWYQTVRDWITTYAPPGAR
jgi:dipeptidyl aminopeptidase/acylaminoacyl peptidase